MRGSGATTFSEYGHPLLSSEQHPSQWRVRCGGRGPVDFTFSKGWSARALIEIKLARNSSFWDGLTAQLPTYQIADGVKTGFFVAIAYKDEELDIGFQRKLDRAARLTSEAHGTRITAALVDATPEKSALKLKDPNLKSKIADSLEDDEGDKPSG
jgi:hypothetical protein